MSTEQTRLDTMTKNQLIDLVIEMTMTAQERKNDHDAEVRSLNAEIAENEAENSELRVKVQDLTLVLGNRELEIHNLRADMADKSRYQSRKMAEQELAIRDLQTEVLKEVQRVHNLQAELEATEIERHNLQIDYETLGDVVAVLEGNLKNARLRSDAAWKREQNDARETIRKVNDAYLRLDDMLSVTVNRLLRQTIAGKSHGKRNVELRALCRDIGQIQSIAFGELPKEDIPF